MFRAKLSMWWRNKVTPFSIGGAQVNRQRYASLLCALLLLSACGFQPLYSKQDRNDSGDFLSAIIITDDGTRPGQLARLAVEENFASRTGESTGTLTLKLRTQESKYAATVEQDGQISRYNIAMITQYEVRAAGQKALITEGAVRAMASYNVVLSDFATYLAEEDARERALRETAEALRSRMTALYQANKDSAIPASGMQP